ncbi:GNAT family N-acetyltransferase [Microbacterium sp. NPDC055903]
MSTHRAGDDVVCVAIDDPRVRAIASEDIRARLGGIPDLMAEQLVAMQLRAKFDALLRRYPDAAAGLVAEDGLPLAYLVTDRFGGVVRLCDIAVSTRVRGQGIGRRLLASVIAEADAAGDAIELSVWHDAPARSWYERHGFRVCGGDPMGDLELRRECGGC